MGRRSFIEITDSEDSDYDSESDEQYDDESDDSDDDSEEESSYDSDEDDESEYEYYYYDDEDEEYDGEMEVFSYSEEEVEEFITLSRVKRAKKQRGGTSKLRKKSKICATKKGRTRSKASAKKDVIRKPLQKKISKKNSSSTRSSRGSSSTCRKKPTNTGSRKGKGKATPAKRDVGRKKKDLGNRPMTFLVFDLETTGLHRIYHRIIEIALVDIDGGGRNTFHSLVNPGRPITNSHIHGITTKMVNRSDVPRMKGMIPNLLRFVKSREKPKGYVVLVAHNARCFDVPFLLNEFKRCSTPIPSNWLFLDTLPLAREAMKSTGSQVRGRTSLQALREHYGVPLVGSAHTAISDVHSLSEVLQRIAIDLNLSAIDLVQKTFTVKDLTIAKLKKKGD